MNKKIMKNKIGSISNYLVGILLGGFGLIYLFKDSFMPYHMAAVSIPWNKLDINIQFLILALMRAVSGGFILAALLIFWLQLKFSETKLNWIPPMILISGSVIATSTLYATIIVRVNTPGNPPIALIIGALILLIIGFTFNRKYANK